LERNVPTEPADMEWWIMHDVSRGPLNLHRTALPDGVRPTVTINTWPLITHMGSFAATIDLARVIGIPVIEANLGRYEALQADELFCTASSFCLVHGATFEGQTVGDGKPGPIFRKLLEAWKELAGLDFVAQAHDYARRLPEWEQQQ